MPVCDACGAQVDDAHIRQRIERLELATRFRPVHISTLLIDVAPPMRTEDYFYRPAADPGVRSPASRACFDALVQCAGVGSAAAARIGEESALAEFQRHGFFLIGAIECPLESGANTSKVIERAAPAVLRRVNVSYKPKSIALLSPLTQPLIAAFQGSDWAARLILDDGKPFDLSVSSDPLARSFGQKGKV